MGGRRLRTAFDERTKWGWSIKAIGRTPSGGRGMAMKGFPDCRFDTRRLALEPKGSRKAQGRQDITSGNGLRRNSGGKGPAGMEKVDGVGPAR